MNKQHTMQVKTDLEANGVVVGTITAKIKVNFHPQCGNGWNEVEEAAHFEMNDVTQISGLVIEPDSLRAWAVSWVEDFQDEIWDDFTKDSPDAD